MDREELLRDIASLGEELERLGAELSEAATALREHGLLPPPRSLDAIEWARQGFERIRAQVLELAQGRTESYCRRWKRSAPFATCWACSRPWRRASAVAPPWSRPGRPRSWSSTACRPWPTARSPTSRHC